jgi:hypothetical protein
MERFTAESQSKDRMQVASKAEPNRFSVRFDHHNPLQEQLIQSIRVEQAREIQVSTLLQR